MDEDRFGEQGRAELTRTAVGTTSEVVTSVSMDPLCTLEVEAAMTAHERAFVTSLENKLKFQSYRFDMTCGSAGGGSFNDAMRILPETWPKRIEINLVNYENLSHPVVGCYKVHYDKFTLQRGDNKRTSVRAFAMNISQGEFITKVRLATSSRGDLRGVIYVEFSTSQGRVEWVGDARGNQPIEGNPPAGFLGLKGFYGGHGGVVDRMGAIWGR